MSLVSNVGVKSPQSPGGSERSIAARLMDDAGAPAPEPAAAHRAKAFMSANAMLKTAWRNVGIPLTAIAIFLVVWSRLSAGIETSLGKIPGPMAVVAQTHALWIDHLA